MQRTGPATVTIFRAEAGMRFQLPVYCGKVTLAKLPHSAYLKIQLPPGKYFFRSNDEQVVEVRLEAGQEFYLPNDASCRTQAWSKRPSRSG